MKYQLIHKASNEIADVIESATLETAKEFFIRRKVMSEEAFDNLYEVREAKPHGKD